MLKEFVEKITSLNENKIHEINGEFYTEKRLERVAPVIDRPTPIKTYSLDSIVKLITSEIDAIKNRVFIQIEDVDEVAVFTTWDDMFVRSTLYNARFRGIEQAPLWRSHDAAMIELRSRYVQNEGTEYLLNILSRITDENSITSRDNGITQEVEARRGVSLASKEVVKPRVKLIPYRTFSEVEQPESEFLVRLREGGEIGLFEADGGAWKLQARENIKNYFEANLKELVKQGKVVVMI